MMQRALPQSRIRMLVLQSLLARIPKCPDKAIVLLLQLTHEHRLSSPGFPYIEQTFITFLQHAIDRHVYQQQHHLLYDEQPFIDECIMNLFYADYFVLKTQRSTFSPHPVNASTTYLQQKAMDLFRQTLSADDLKGVLLEAIQVSPPSEKLKSVNECLRLLEREKMIDDRPALLQLHLAQHPKATYYLLKYCEQHHKQPSLITLCGCLLLSLRNEERLSAHHITPLEKNHMEGEAQRFLQTFTGHSLDRPLIPKTNLSYSFFSKDKVAQPTINIPLLRQWLLHFLNVTKTIDWAELSPHSVLLSAHEQYDILKSFCQDLPHPMNIAFLQETLTLTLAQGFKELQAPVPPHYFVIPLALKERITMTIQLCLSRQISAIIEQI